MLEATPNIQHQSCICPSYPASSVSVKCSVAFVIAVPETDSVLTTAQQENLYLNYGPANSLNMFIFLWLALGLVHGKLILNRQPSISKKVLFTNLFILFADGLRPFVLHFSALIFFCVIRLSAERQYA